MNGQMDGRVPPSQVKYHTYLIPLSSKDSNGFLSSDPRPERTVYILESWLGKVKSLCFQCPAGTTWPWDHFFYRGLVHFIESPSLTVLVDSELHRISPALNRAWQDIWNLRASALLWFALLSLAKDRLGDISLQLTNNNWTLQRLKKLRKTYAADIKAQLPLSPLNHPSFILML